MIIPVHMLAFHNDRSVIRNVNIPDYEFTEADGIPEQILELVFEYGQNEFQPQEIASVSVGDVANLDGVYYMCAPMGWDKISKDEFDKLVPPTASYPYQKKIKKSIGSEQS